MLWILISFNADSDPAFYLNADPDPGSQTNADADPDPDPGQTLKSQKVKFLHENIVKVGDRSKSIPTKLQNLFEMQEPGSQFWSTFMLLNPDPRSR